MWLMLGCQKLIERRMNQNYKEKVCKGCSETKLIVYVSGCLCMTCNQSRLSKRYSERAKSRPKFSDKAIKTMKSDKKVYKELWETKAHFCEECSKALPNVTAEVAASKCKYVFSHILKKGMYGRIRHDLRNFNLLCFDCHDLWESANTRKTMKIMKKNKLVIVKLLKEYGYTA